MFSRQGLAVDDQVQQASWPKVGACASLFFRNLIQVLRGLLHSSPGLRRKQRRVKISASLTKATSSCLSNHEALLSAIPRYIISSGFLPIHLKTQQKRLSIHLCLRFWNLSLSGIPEFPSQPLLYFLVSIQFPYLHLTNDRILKIYRLKEQQLKMEEPQASGTHSLMQVGL